MIQRIEQVKLQLHGDARGQLVAIEGCGSKGGGDYPLRSSAATTSSTPRLERCVAIMPIGS